MIVEIETRDKHLAFDLMDPNSVSAGASSDVPGNATITFETMVTGKGFLGGPEVITVALNLGEGVVASLVAAWLYDKLKKGKATKLQIDQTEVEIEKGAIKRVVETHIKIGK